MTTTHDELVKLGKEAGFTDGDFASFTDLIVRYGQLVAEAEREACANLCNWETGIESVDAAIETCAAAIRARGEE